MLVDIWFFVSMLGIVASVPLHYVSVEHLKFRKRFGERQGTRIAEVFGLVSGWGFFCSWFGIWIAPQTRFVFPFLSDVSISIAGFSIPLLHLVISILLVIPGSWFGIKGVKGTTLKVAETHRAERIVTSGVYSTIRHPQYFGGLLSHLGITFLFSALYSLASTPLIIGLVYLISRKEETELVREFGEDYEDYRKQVPMLIPKLRRKQTAPS
jgi:protein-S-isoprenylcysteine O-methyltransferase Ste14